LAETAAEVIFSTDEIEFAPDPASLTVNQRAIKGDTSTSRDAEIILVFCGEAFTKSL
jgi:hypothetical protein